MFKKLSYNKLKDDLNIDEPLINKKKYIKAKYKNKYYNCKILENYGDKSKVLYISSKYISIIDNKDIIY